MFVIHFRCDRFISYARGERAIRNCFWNAYGRERTCRHEVWCGTISCDVTYVTSPRYATPYNVYLALGLWRQTSFPTRFCLPQFLHVYCVPQTIGARCFNHVKRCVFPWEIINNFVTCVPATRHSSLRWVCLYCSCVNFALQMLIAIIWCW